MRFRFPTLKPGLSRIIRVGPDSHDLFKKTHAPWLGGLKPVFISNGRHSKLPQM